jgi:S-adenosylmethionine hydrolase
MMKKVFKEDNDMAKIIHLKCYGNHRPYQAAVTRKWRGLKIQSNITANVWASMSKKEIAKMRVRDQEAKKKIQYHDFYGSDTSSGTQDLFDNKDCKYDVHKMS